LYLEHDKNVIFLFLENMHKKTLELGRVHEKKNIFFCVFEIREFFEFF
jgi:hypothetical protein